MSLILLWWFVVLIAGFTTFPITFVVLKHLPDKGYIFSKILGLMLMGYLTWLLGYVSFGGGTIFFSFVLLVGISGLLLWSWIGKYFFDFLKKNVGYFLFVEFFFLMSFLVAGAYKMRTHDIAGTEKPMDFAMINGILASPSMPPVDPWLSGCGISYYYFGYLIIAMLCKLTSSFVTSGEGYNLGVALIWALAASGAFSLGYALTKRYRYSFFSAACLTVFGNLDYWHRAVQSFQVGDIRVPYYNFPTNPNAPAGFKGAFEFLLSPLDHYWDYFQASRIIPVPPADKMINEFPSFSFFLSDLHPHVMAIPFILLAIALAFNLLKGSVAGFGVFGGTKPWQILQWVLLALVFGGLSFMNSWDFPSMMFLLGVCLFLQQWWNNDQGFEVWFKSVSLIGIPIVIGAFFLYMPFYVKFQSQAQGIGLSDDRTDLYHLGIIFGLFFTIFIPAFIGRAYPTKTEKPNKNRVKRPEELLCTICGKAGVGKKYCGFCGGELALPAFTEITAIPEETTRTLLSKWGGLFFRESEPARGWIVLGGLAVVMLGLNFEPLKFSTILLSLLILSLGLISAAVRTESKEMIFSGLLVMIAFLLIFSCEVMYLRDLFTGALYRMNTVFKFHYEAWILFSVASGPFLKWLLENSWPRWAAWKKTSWLILAGFVFLGAFLYPVLAFTARMRGSAADVVTLDGSVFYDHVFPTDYQAAQWIKSNVRPVGKKIPVVLEAWGGSYHQEYARLATNTGYPTILGWDFHEVQWRGSGDKAVVRGQDPDDTIVRRQGDVDAIYTSPDINLTRDLLRKYKVDYVYVGDIEKQKYKDRADNLGKFSQLGTVAQTFGGSVLYRLNP